MEKLDDYTSRKFILAILAMGQVSVGFWQGKVPVTYWLIFLGSTFLGYGVLNFLGTMGIKVGQDNAKS